MLMKKIKESSKVKMEKIYILYEQPMYRVAYAILNSTEVAEDAVSEAFIKIAENIDKIGDTKSEKTKHYLIKIIKNTSINIYRKNKLESLRTTGDEQYIYVEDVKVKKEYEEVESHDIIQQLISGISEKYRNIVIMRCIQGMSYGEIALTLNENPAAVRKQYERARKQMKNMNGGVFNENNLES